MAVALLGDHFDIHGGGQDLLFPHHENEIAQSEGAHGHPFVNYWVHNGFVRVDNEKMSKSLGNFFTIREVLTRYDAEVVRFFLVRPHYRSPSVLRQHLTMTAGLTRLYRAARRGERCAARAGHDRGAPTLPLRGAVDGNFNARGRRAVRTGQRGEPHAHGADAALLRALGEVLGATRGVPAGRIGADWRREIEALIAPHRRAQGEELRRAARIARSGATVLLRTPPAASGAEVILALAGKANVNAGSRV
jgi:cysteinyl-tRNA synthetase